MESLYKKLGVHIPEILLPVKGTDFGKWSVIACDQYTSQPDYWQKVKDEVGDSPSTLKLTFPEIYLKDENKEERILKINETMAKYLEQGIIKAQKPGLILVDRSTPRSASRKGLILALDLECYDYRPGSQALIRATEGTVLERIPPRVKIRENAPIELPHIMVLIDDPEKTVIEPLFNKSGSFEKLYDFELMQGGGHIRGWKIEDQTSLSLIAEALQKLTSGSNPLLFAVGDGNHSLASAKAHWENVKSALTPEEAAAHPARFALVEVVNVHDEGLAFEPIHRVLFGIDSKTVLGKIINICNRRPYAGNSAECGLYDPKENTAEYRLFSSRDEMVAALKAASPACNASTAAGGPHLLPFIIEGAYGLLTVKSTSCSLEVGTLQNILDELQKNSSGLEIDYIHGEQVVTELGSQKNCIGFYLPVMDKHDLFRTVISDGVLPRKNLLHG